MACSSRFDPLYELAFDDASLSLPGATSVTLVASVLHESCFFSSVTPAAIWVGHFSFLVLGAAVMGESWDYSAHDIAAALKAFPRLKNVSCVHMVSDFVCNKNNLIHFWLSAIWTVGWTIFGPGL